MFKNKRIKQKYASSFAVLLGLPSFEHQEPSYSGMTGTVWPVVDSVLDSLSSFVDFALGSGLGLSGFLQHGWSSAGFALNGTGPRTPCITASQSQPEQGSSLG